MTLSPRSGPLRGPYEIGKEAPPDERVVCRNVPLGLDLAV
jgi:hypothetical protein